MEAIKWSGLKGASTMTTLAAGRRARRPCRRFIPANKNAKQCALAQMYISLSDRRVTNRRFPLCVNEGEMTSRWGEPMRFCFTCNIWSIWEHDEFMEFTQLLLFPVLFWSLCLYFLPLSSSECVPDVFHLCLIKCALLVLSLVLVFLIFVFMLLFGTLPVLTLTCWHSTGESAVWCK